jgi:hypothetical protein
MMMEVAMIGRFLIAAALACAAASPAPAEWKPANEAVAQAARDPAVAAALDAAARLDAALIADDHAAFADGLAADLVVNNPQNAVSMPGETARIAAAGRIRYSSYLRTIEYAGRRGELVVLMGEERVVRRDAPPGEVELRRFTDIWRPDGGKWRLTARQATRVPPP